MDKQQLKHRWQVFRRWQRKPHAVAPLSPDDHECATCGTHFQGNFCPRCGQSSRVSRYSFKTMFLLFIDVWGLGNQGMVHSVRDLILRPGYMIRDYLRGMQRAYFPPFKMLFLFTAFSLIVDSGFNLRHRNNLSGSNENSVNIDINNNDSKRGKTPTNGIHISDNQKQAFNDIINTIGKKMTDNPSLTEIIMLFLLSGPWYLFLRNGPSYPGMHFSEFFVASVYSSNMISLYGMAVSFLGFNTTVQAFFPLLVVVPMRQLTGCTWTRIILSLLVSVLLVLAAIVFVLSLVFFVMIVFMIGV